MKIYIGSDHAGLELKLTISAHLKSLKYEVVDLGTNSKDSCDYPDFAVAVAESVVNDNTFGILICYTGIGMSIAANKVKGTRAALVSNEENAELTRAHNNANILCLGAKDVNVLETVKIVDKFLNTEFLGGRHERRVNKIVEIESKYVK